MQQFSEDSEPLTTPHITTKRMMTKKVEPFQTTIPQVEERFPKKIRGLAKGIPVSVCTG